jgi:hypothetical protein
MASADASAGSTRMAGTHLFQLVAHPELSKLWQVAIRDFLKMRARYLLLVKENNKAEGVNITPTTVVASLDPDLLENLACMGKIKDAVCAEDCTDEKLMSYHKSNQCKDAALTAEDIKNEVRSKVVFHMSEKDPALRVTKAVGDYMMLHRNLKLDLVKGKPRRPSSTSSLQSSRFRSRYSSRAISSWTSRTSRRISSSSSSTWRIFLSCTTAMRVQRQRMAAVAQIWTKRSSQMAAAAALAENPAAMAAAEMSLSLQKRSASSRRQVTAKAGRSARLYRKLHLPV